MFQNALFLPKSKTLLEVSNYMFVSSEREFINNSFSEDLKIWSFLCIKFLNSKRKATENNRTDFPRRTNSEKHVQEKTTNEIEV